MLAPGAHVQIFVCLEPADMRKGFDGLAAIVTESLGEDPLCGALFVFRNRRGDRLKLLYWDNDGYALWYKRLEAGTFELPAPKEDGSRRVTISAADLAMLLDGVDLRSIRRRKRYRKAS